jgi:hypothetical protein
MILTFFQSKSLSDPIGENMKELNPQNPVPQTWIVDYPLLAYKSYVPQNNELIVLNIANEKAAERIINFEDHEFLCFVNHAQMCE